MKYRGLNKLRILITRPAHQSKNLVACLDQLNAVSILFPVIAIEPKMDHPSLQKALLQYEQADYLIFTSANSVDYAVSAIKTAQKTWPPSKPAFAIGEATQRRLNALGMQDVQIPDGHFSSEALLMKMAAQSLKDKNIIIFGGENPRPFLEMELVKRKANVLHGVCYERISLKKKMTQEEQTVLLNSVDVILCTSNEVLIHLVEIFDDSERAKLFLKPFLIISKRMESTLKTLNYTKSPIVADNSSDSGIIAALTHWYEEYSHG